MEWWKNIDKTYPKGIEEQKNSMDSITDSLMTVFHNLGIGKDKSNSIRSTQNQPKSNEEIKTSEKKEPITPKKDKETYNEDVFKTTKSIEKWCEYFKTKIEWVSNIDWMINLLKNLIETKKLDVKFIDTWREIILDCLNYKIKILNLWNSENKINFWSYNISTRNSHINHSAIIYETDEKGLEKISNKRIQWWKVASQKDIQDILKSLAKNYNLIAGKKWKAHDEDIAFFMLMTQCDGEFLLQKDKLLGKNRVLKQYHDFRWFKDLKEHWTGQIILIRKK